MFLTSLKQICNEYLIKFSENQSAPKLENRKTSPCSPCAPNLLHVLMSRTTGYHNLCSPGFNLFSFYVKALMMSSCWQFKLELKFYSSFAFLGSGEAVGRWARVKREFNWLKRFKHLQCVMRELTKERRNGMNKN